MLSVAVPPCPPCFRSGRTACAVSLLGLSVVIIKLCNCAFLVPFGRSSATVLKQEEIKQKQQLTICSTLCTTLNKENQTWLSLLLSSAGGNIQAFVVSINFPKIELEGTGTSFFLLFRLRTYSCSTRLYFFANLLSTLRPTRSSSAYKMVVLDISTTELRWISTCAAAIPSGVFRYSLNFCSNFLSNILCSRCWWLSSSLSSSLSFSLSSSSSSSLLLSFSLSLSLRSDPPTLV